MLAVRRTMLILRRQLINNRIIDGQIPACPCTSTSFFRTETIKKSIYYNKRSGRQVKAKKEQAMKKKAELGENFKSKHELKTPKGTRDFGPEQMAVREKVLGIITDTFKRHGAVTIDTPVFELRKVLMGKYGEDSTKLVYDLEAQEGELYSLRYDLTVPFARYLAINKIEKIKRYQIAKVYRRDQPVMTKGRYREFYQCDFDIAGHGDLMVQEAECLKIIDEVLSALELGDFEIRVNHRQLLEGMFAASGISPSLFKTVSSTVDKLDKQPWAEVKEELIKEKGVDEPAAEALGNFVGIRDEHPDWDNCALFKWFSEAKWSDDGSNNNKEKVVENIRQAIEELQLLFSYADMLGCDKKRVVFQPSLARGLDYYTGAIYEVILKDFSFDPNALSLKGAKKGKTSQQAVAEEEGEEEGSGNLGSVAAGGRYDKLVGTFLNMGGAGEGKPAKGKQLRDVPCVGVSFGIERLFTVMEMKMQAKEETTSIRTSPTQVFVASVKTGAAGEGVKQSLMHERMRVCQKLWNAGIRAETSYKANPKLLEQFQFCEQDNNKIPWLVIVAEDELAQESVKLRCVPTREEMLVKLDELVPVLLGKLGQQPI